MITDPYFYAVTIPAVLLLGISKSGFGAGFGSLAVPMMALAVTVQAISLPCYGALFRRLSAQVDSPPGAPPPVWLHEDAYYTGLVGQRYSRAIALRADPIAASQVARLRSIMRFPNFADIDPNPRLTWMPLRLIRAWMSDVLQKQVGELTREDNLLTLVGTPYAYLESKVGEKTETAVLFGWLSMDMSLFRPPYTRLVDDEGEQESAEEALEHLALLLVELTIRIRCADSRVTWLSASDSAYLQRFAADSRDELLDSLEDINRYFAQLGLDCNVNVTGFVIGHLDGG